MKRLISAALVGFSLIFTPVATGHNHVLAKCLCPKGLPCEGKAHGDTC